MRRIVPLPLLALLAGCSRPDAKAAHASAPPAAAASSTPAPSDPAAEAEPSGDADPESPYEGAPMGLAGQADTAWKIAPPAEGRRLAGKITTANGVLAITRDSTPPLGPFFTTWGVWVSDHRVLADSAMLNVSIHAVMEAADGRSLVVLEMTPGGTACGAMYRVVELRFGKPPLITPEFGNCNDLARVIPRRGTLRMRFPGFHHRWQTREPGFRAPPDQLYEYRDARMVRLRGGPFDFIA